MTQEEYRAAVDAVPFSPDFQAKTLRRLGDALEHKEELTMKTKKGWKPAVAIAAAVCLLVVGVSAAAMLLSPAQVAERIGNPALAKAFAPENAVTINEARKVGDYNVTFMGLTSGKNLWGVAEEQNDALIPEQIYAVLAYERIDGQPIASDSAPLTVTPLVEGYAPWEMNAWVLSGSMTYFTEGGTFYYLISCDTPQPKNNGDVYLAVYPGTHISPSAQIFTYDADTGAIAFQPGQEGVLFSLPLN